MLGILIMRGDNGTISSFLLFLLSLPQRSNPLSPFIILATVYSKHYTNSDYALNVLRRPRSINDNGY